MDRWTAERFSPRPSWGDRLEGPRGESTMEAARRQLERLPVDDELTCARRRRVLLEDTGPVHTVEADCG